MNFSRRVRPQLDDDEQLSVSDRPRESSVESSGNGADSESEGMSDPGSEADSESNAHATISRISFATLTKAQDSLAKDRRKSQSKERPPTGATHSEPERRGKTEKPKRSGHTHRSSKNAPQEVSSKRAVTRKREVVEPVSRLKARDPRFDPAVSGRYDEHEFRKNYSFLDDYKDGEMKMLKDEIKKTRDGSRAEQLAKKLKSMESQRQSQRNKDKVREVLEQHKKEEREKVKQGKKAYFLKPSEAKTRVLQEEFSKLSDRQVEKTMARKQKRKAQKERKNMPWARRES